LQAGCTYTVGVTAALRAQIAELAQRWLVTSTAALVRMKAVFQAPPPAAAAAAAEAVPVAAAVGWQVVCYLS